MTLLRRGPQEAFDTIDTILCSNQCSSQTEKAMIFPVRNKFSQTIMLEFLHGGSLALSHLPRLLNSGRWYYSNP